MGTPLSVLLKLTPYFYRRGLEIAKEFFRGKASVRLHPARGRTVQKGKVIDIWQVVLHYPDDAEIANWQQEYFGCQMLNSFPRGYICVKVRMRFSDSSREASLCSSGRC
jgi:hypothetical protein